MQTLSLFGLATSKMSAKKWSRSSPLNHLAPPRHDLFYSVIDTSKLPLTTTLIAYRTSQQTHTFSHLFRIKHTICQEKTMAMEQSCMCLANDSPPGLLLLLFLLLFIWLLQPRCGSVIGSKSMPFLKRVQLFGSALCLFRKSKLLLRKSLNLYFPSLSQEFAAGMTFGSVTYATIWGQ